MPVHVVDVVGVELGRAQCEEDGSVVGKRLNRWLGTGEVPTQGSESDGVEEIGERDRLAVQVGGDRPVSASRYLRRIRCLDIVTQERAQVLVSGHERLFARRGALLRLAACLRASSLDSLSR